MATLKHIASKNADYGAAEQYLTFEHDEFTGKPILDENGRLIPREDYSTYPNSFSMASSVSLSTIPSKSIASMILNCACSMLPFFP